MITPKHNSFHNTKKQPKVIDVPGGHSSGCFPASQKLPLGQIPPVESLLGLGILAPRKQKYPGAQGPETSVRPVPLQ